MIDSGTSVIPSTNGSGTPVRIDQCGPQTLSGRYLRQFWTPIAMLDDVAPGRAKTIQMMGELFTYYRGTSGEPHLVAALCAHRHVQLAVGWVEGDCIRCPYHGWKYDASGQCIEQPAEFDSFARMVRIEGYPTRVFHGLVFCFLGPGAPPAFPRIAALERDGYIVASSYIRDTNFLNAVENNADFIHINFVHARSAFTDLGVNRALPTISAEETRWGIAGHCTYADGNATHFHILMPITSYFRGTAELPSAGSPYMADHISWRVPIDDYRHRSFKILRVHLGDSTVEQFLEQKQDQRRLQASLSPQREVVNAILRGDLHVDEVSRHRPDIVGIQDEAVMLTQAPLGERGADQLGLSDVPVIKLRRLWYREIDALAHGQPTTEWDWSSDDLIAELGIA